MAQPAIFNFHLEAIAVAQRIWGTEVPQKLKQFADTFFTDLDYKNDQNLKFSYNPPLILCTLDYNPNK